MPKSKYVRLHPDDMGAIAQLIREAVDGEGRLLNLTELAEALGVGYGTLAAKSLPHYRIDGGRKMYRLSEILNLFRVEADR